MTNFEYITQSTEILAVVITEVLHQESLKYLQTLRSAGIDVSFVSLDTDLQVQIHKEWLESEMNENEENNND